MPTSIYQGGNGQPEIFRAMNRLDASAAYPVHYRNKQRALRLQEQCGFISMLLVEPLDYMESVYLVKPAKNHYGIRRSAVGEVLCKEKVRDDA